MPPLPRRAPSIACLADPNSPLPEVHLLSNGRYHVMATHAGGGYSRWHDLAVTRWREDATCDGYGTFIYLRDRKTGSYWSTAYQPTRSKGERYEAVFVQARAEYRRVDHAIEAHTEISVSPEDDVEVRRVTLTNLSDDTREIEVTSYAEVVMAPLNADLAHRAFSNLFVQTEILPRQGAILCRRRPRTPEEQPPWMFHLLAAPGAFTGQSSYETDRAQFIGRGRTAANPVAFDNRDGSATLSNTEGPVLDPIVAVRNAVTLSRDQSATVHMVSGVAETREAALALIGKYGDRHFVERAFEMAWFESQEVLRLLDVTEADAQIYGRLATSVIHGNALRRADPSIIARNQLGQAGLWRFGISGDLPIVLVRIGDVSRIDVVKQTLQAHAYWRIKGLAADLVILNEDFSGYRAVLHDEILGLINAGPEAAVIDKPGGVFVQARGRAVRRRPGTVPDRRPSDPRGHRRDVRRAGTAPRAGRAPTGSPRALASTGRRGDRAAAGAGQRLSQRPRRLHARRSRIRHQPGTRTEHAGAVGERDRESLRGNSRQRKRERLHVGGERARIPPDHISKRPGQRQQW